MKTKWILPGLLSPLALLLATGCETQGDAALSQAYRPVAVGTVANDSARVYAYDPYYHYSGTIFPYKDFYWYGRPPFYVETPAPLRKFTPDR